MSFKFQTFGKFYKNFTERRKKEKTRQEKLKSKNREKKKKEEKLPLNMLGKMIM